MVNLSGFSVYKIVSFANDTNKIIFLPFRSGCLLFLSCPVSWIRTSSTTLNRNGENKLPFHFLDLREETIQSFTINSGVSYGFSVDALYHTEKVSFCS